MALVRPRKFAHVVYRTRRFDQMLAWYQTVFDATIQYQNPALAFLTYDDEHHRFALANLAALRPEESETEKHGLVGVDHVAYTYSSIDDLFENYEQLKAIDIEPYWCIHHGVTVSMYYADPDGNQIEFQVEVFGTAEEANAYMCDPGYGDNPIGVEFDPEDWLAQIRTGTPISDFLVRRVHEPMSPIRGALAR
jgi:catechol 2,3-dioxygenase-like lactoylglutathione lyase family enzyme